MTTTDMVISNRLIEATHQPGGVWRMRLFMACLLQISAKNGVRPDKVFTVRADELSDLCGTKRNANYAELKNAADDLCHLGVRLECDIDGTPIPKGFLHINMVSRCQYYEGDGRVEIVLSPDILPYVSSLVGNFTKVKAREIMPMRSQYGVRLYLLLSSWISDERIFTVSDLRIKLGAVGVAIRTDHFRDGVLAPAIKDIERTTDMRVCYKQRKNGRRVTHFIFQIIRPESPNRNKQINHKSNGKSKPLANEINDVHHPSHEEYKLKIETPITINEKEDGLKQLRVARAESVGDKVKVKPINKSMDRELTPLQEEMIKQNTNKPVGSGNFGPNPVSNEQFETLELGENND